MSNEDIGGGASLTTDPAQGSSQATDVSLREFVGQAIRYERIINRVLIGGFAAICIYSWTEIQRRLANLNHESTRIKEAQNASVSADTYKANEEQRKSEMNKRDEWERGVTEKLTQTATRDEVTSVNKVEKKASISTTTQVAGAVIATIALVFIFLNYQASHKPIVVQTPIVTTTVPTK